MSLYSLIIAQHPPTTKDYRLGALGIDWIDYHSEKEIPQDLVLKTVKLDQGDSPPRRFTRGATGLGPGIVHLFRHATVPPQQEAEGEDGTLVAVLAVPRWMGFEEFGDWLGAWTTRLEGYRIIRDASPNKTLALLKFHETTAANDFTSVHTGTTFSRTPEKGETCHPIRIHHLLLHDLATSAPETRLTALLHVPKETTYELPTCPVCLERMDATVTGLVTTPCTHAGDCQCLARWTSDLSTTCPVCRIANGGAGETRCMACPGTRKREQQGEKEGHSNWICIVCAYLGCSRYEAGHARDHFTRTGHAFSMEIETGRVWNYIEDNYVHRLIQNKSDGKLVELPSATLSTRMTSLNLASAGPTASDEKWVTSLERATGEAQRLAAQLAEREEAFAREMERVREERERGTAERERERGEMERLKKEVQEGEGKLRELEQAMAELERDKMTAEKKAQIATTLSRTLQKDLAAEKSLTTGLLQKIRMLEGTLSQTTEREKAAQERVKEMEETVGDLMASISMGERVKENGGEGGDVVTQMKKKGRR